MVELKGYKFNSIEFKNKVANGTELKLQNQFKYNVNYADRENKCLGILEFRVADQQMNPFEIKLEMIAEFTYGADDDKADIHVESFAQMFPYLRQVITTVTAMSGVPGLMIPFIRLNKENVQIGKPKNEDEEIILN